MRSPTDWGGGSVSGRLQGAPLLSSELSMKTGGSTSEL
jgi:hypothetical protein